MSTQDQDHFPEVQAHIYRLALSVDSFLLNGIAFGACSDAFPGMVRKLADTLLADLETLEQDRPLAPVVNQQKAGAAFRALRPEIHSMIDLATGLIAFRSLSLLELRRVAAQISLGRNQCVALIEELERSFDTPKQFYRTRPASSTLAVNAFIADLGRVLEDAWHAAKSEAPVSST